ncbi:MAG: DUF3108 domain-containing protein [Candidatus Omnitrophica bacterium]|nr:DUF3108 domain-containing protein [Candidatus Omnitrophota bacterium]
MKKLWLILAILAVFITIANYQNNNNPVLIISHLISDTGIKSNATLAYKINLFSVFPAGDAVFDKMDEELFQNKKVYHLTARAETAKIISKFFSASALLDSYLDPQSNNPVFFKQKLQISGKKDIQKEINYDQKQKLMTISGVSRDILPDTQDPLSAMFNIRKMNFDQISSFEMNINTNQKNYLLSAKVSPKEITLDDKKYQLFILDGDIKRRNKNPYHRTIIRIVLLKDKENIPILVKIFSSGLLINAKLIDIK